MKLQGRLTNREAIEITLGLLSSPDPGKRLFAAETIGGIARHKNGDLRQQVLSALQAISDNVQEPPLLRRLAWRSIEEITGAADAISEKYDLRQLPVGSPSDQYYLKRG